MPGITKRKDGRYQITKYQNGIRIYQYTRKYNEAIKIKKQLEKNNLEKNKEKNVQTLNEWIIEWLETYKKPFIKQKSYADIKNICNKISAELGIMNLKDIKTKNIQIFLNNIEKGRTKERICTYLNAILQKAEDLDIINKNPFKAVVKEQKGTYKNYCFNYQEQEKIINAIKKSDIEKEILLYLMTGCRPAELPKHLQIENLTIEINGTKNKNAKKRLIPISQEFANYLKKNLNEIHNYNYVQKVFKNICIENKIEKPLLYRLRHTFATNHFVLGTQAKYVQEWLGHSSISLTLDTYTDIDNTLSRDKIIKLYNNFYYKTKN